MLSENEGEKKKIEKARRGLSTDGMRFDRSGCKEIADEDEREACFFRKEAKSLYSYIQ